MSSLLLPKLFASQHELLPKRHALEYLSDDGLWSILAHQATRRVVKAQFELFSIDQPARSYFLVESGELLAYRPGAGRQKAAVRALHDGDLFSFACGEHHAASCVATVDSLIRQIDRRVLSASARTSPVVSCVLQAMHAAELEMILESLPCDRDAASADKQISLHPGAFLSEKAVVLRPDFRPRRTRRS